MEYHQITLNEWMEVKKKLMRAVEKAANGFIELGYELRQIEEQRLYEAGGYSSIAEFAENEPEFGLSPALVSRLINVNRTFADPIHPKQIRTEYNRYGMTKLAEMLSLPESDRDMIRPETRRDDIRELKRFNKESKQAADFAEEEQEMDELHMLIRDFFEKSPEVLNEIYSSEAYTEGDITKMAEIVNPSGNKTFRRGILFMMMYEDVIKIKKMGGNPESLRWSDFFTIMQEIFEQAAAGSRTWDNYFNAGGADERNRNDGTDRGAVQDAEGGSGEYSGRLPAEGAGADPEREKVHTEDAEGSGETGGRVNDPENGRAERLEVDTEEDPAVEEPEEEPGGLDGINPPDSSLDNVDSSEIARAQFDGKTAESLNETASRKGEEIIVDESGRLSPELEEAQEEAIKERITKAVEKVNELVGTIEAEIDSHHWTEAEEKTEQMLKSLAYLRRNDVGTARQRMLRGE